MLNNEGQKPSDQLSQIPCKTRPFVVEIERQRVLSEIIEGTNRSKFLSNNRVKTRRKEMKKTTTNAKILQKTYQISFTNQYI